MDARAPNAKPYAWRAGIVPIALTLALAACGGGGGGGGGGNNPPPPGPPPPPPPPTDPLYQVSNLSPFAGSCGGPANGGTVFINAEVEPYLAVDPNNNQRMVGAWQQDRWSNGSARGVVSGFSNDGGLNWTLRPLPFSICGGGNATNGGNYARATDPWVTITPDGTVHAMGLATTGGSFQPGSVNAMLAVRSVDGGNSWSTVRTLIQDGAGFFNDKNSMTADPTRIGYVYATWDRLAAGGGGPTMFTRTTDNGLSWEPARAIFDPGSASQTIGNLIVVLEDGTLVNLFTLIDGSGPNERTSLQVMRSTNQGTTWSAPVEVAELLGIGAKDPETGAPVRDGAILGQIAAAPTGNTLYVVWQDARFTSGARDAIAISRSTDGGLTWSAPTRVSTDPGVAAFTPSVHVLDNGTVGVTWYDFRSNTGDSTTLPTDYWLATSSNGGSTWTETRVAPPFDLAIAANAGGLFVGDYQALKDRNGVFVPFFVRTGSNTGNRSNVWAAPAVSAVAATGIITPQAVGGSRIAPATAVVPPRLRGKVERMVEWNMQHRVAGWGVVTMRPPARPRDPSARDLDTDRRRGPGVRDDR